LAVNDLRGKMEPDCSSIRSLISSSFACASLFWRADPKSNSRHRGLSASSALGTGVEEFGSDEAKRGAPGLLGGMPRGLELRCFRSDLGMMESRLINPACKVALRLVIGKAALTLRGRP